MAKRETTTITVSGMPLKQLSQIDRYAKETKRTRSAAVQWLVDRGFLEERQPRPVAGHAKGNRSR